MCSATSASSSCRRASAGGLGRECSSFASALLSWLLDAQRLADLVEVARLAPLEVLRRVVAEHLLGDAVGVSSGLWSRLINCARMRRTSGRRSAREQAGAGACEAAARVGLKPSTFRCDHARAAGRVEVLGAVDAAQLQQHVVVLRSGSFSCRRAIWMIVISRLRLSRASLLSFNESPATRVSRRRAWEPTPIASLRRSCGLGLYRWQLRAARLPPIRVTSR
jgi:hypothetical protein